MCITSYSLLFQYRASNTELNNTPQIANAGISIAPTIQTDITSLGKDSIIPSGRYADVAKAHQEDDKSKNDQSKYIPRTIRIQPTRFAKNLNGTIHTINTLRRERQEEGTITTGNTSSGKTDKELELETKNEKLEQEVAELKKGLLTLQIQMSELITAMKTDKRTDTTPQRKKYKRTGYQKEAVQDTNTDMEDSANKEYPRLPPTETPNIHRTSHQSSGTRDDAIDDTRTYHPAEGHSLK
jgi:hypothetical protein